MRNVHSYTTLDLSEACAQWLSVESRVASPGRRQAIFEPVETLLCLAASLIVDHTRYGGSSSHRAEEPVPMLAQLFRRPNGSVIAKMANLYGTRPNGGRGEAEAAVILLEDLGRLAALYCDVLVAAREVGIGPDRLSDFLNIGDEPDEFLLLGQDEVDLSAINADVSVALIGSDRSTADSLLTERLIAAVTRVGQHRFASAVLSNQGFRCAFCGLAVRSGDRRARRMLVASHIKPWRDSTAAERLDVRNGLAACPSHDVGFDTGLLTVDLDLQIHVNPDVRAIAGSDPAMRAVFGSPPLFDRLRLIEGSAPPAEVYLNWHHKHVYRTGLGA